MGLVTFRGGEGNNFEEPKEGPENGQGKSGSHLLDGFWKRFEGGLL